MDIRQYIEKRGLEGTINDMVELGPQGILEQLGPGPGECRRVVAQSEQPFNEVTVELSNGFIRRDFAVRERFERLLGP